MGASVKGILMLFWQDRQLPHVCPANPLFLPEKQGIRESYSENDSSAMTAA
jgi:hypothetical protein